MEIMSNTKVRQNELKAIELLKASKRCLRHERGLTYFMIFLSFGICLAAILNRYLPQMLSSVDNVLELQAKASTYINLISGAILVANIPLSFYTSRMHTEGTVLQDRFESYVFETECNNSILRPISDTHIRRYSHGTINVSKKYYNTIFGESESVNDNTAQYEYIKREVYSDYDLYLSVQPFFLTIWIGFFILIIIIAISFDDKFITTLINILIPSLSAITTIFASWHACQLQMRQLTNLISCIEKIEALSQEKKRQYITDKSKMRLLADGLFNYRVSSFIIPDFLVQIHNYVIKRAQIKNEEALSKLNNTQKEKTSKPTTQSASKAPAKPSIKHTTIQVIQPLKSNTNQKPTSQTQAKQPTPKASESNEKPKQTTSKQNEQVEKPKQTTSKPNEASEKTKQPVSQKPATQSNQKSSTQNTKQNTSTNKSSKK